MFEGLAVDKIQSLTAQEIENLEADRMKFNAVRVCEEVCIEGAAGPGGYLKSHVTKSLESCSSWTKILGQLFV